MRRGNWLVRDLLAQDQARDGWLGKSGVRVGCLPGRRVSLAVREWAESGLNCETGQRGG